MAEDPSAVRRHRLLELALLLTEATGRRISSVRKLRRSDLLLDEDRDFACARIRWRYEHDKMGKALEVPIPRELAVVLHVLVGQLGVIGDALVFAQAGNLTRATAARELTQWLADMENLAGLLHVPGGAWHAFRRKWSKERKDLPVKDVMAAGGWEDVNTFLASYNEADVKTMLAVREAPARRRAEVAAREERAAAGNLDEGAAPARPNLRVL